MTGTQLIQTLDYYRRCYTKDCGTIINKQVNMTRRRLNIMKELLNKSRLFIILSENYALCLDIKSKILEDRMNKDLFKKLFC
jgi:hypothetical protein